jgi:hypothetical protein
MDEEHAAFHTPRTRVTTAAKLITEADDREVIDSDDALIIQGALKQGQLQGHQTDKIRNFGVFSVRNLALGAVSLIAGSTIIGYFTGIGEEIAKQSFLATKIERFVLDNEADLQKFLSDLPADVRSAMRQFLSDLKGRLRSKS